MDKGELINEGMREFLQEWFVKPQLLDSDDDEVRNERAEGIKRLVQKAFVKKALMEWDDLEGLLEDSDMNALFEAIEKKDSKKQAKAVFENAIEEVKKVIAPEYGLAPKRKKEHEILAEELDKRFGKGHINHNINKLIQKSIGSGGSSGCESGSCGC